MENFERDFKEDKSTNDKNKEFNLVWVEKKEWQDNLKINSKEYERFSRWLESTDSIDKIEKPYFFVKLDQLKNKLDSLNKKLDDLMDVSFFDKGKVDIEDGQDTVYLEKISKDMNKIFNEDLHKLMWKKDSILDKIDNMFSKLDKDWEEWTKVERLKKFIGGKEEEKTKKTDKILFSLANGILGKKTVDNINKRNDIDKYLDAEKSNIKI